MGQCHSDRPDLAALFRSHANGLAGAVRGVLGRGGDVQEILQEAFLVAWQRREDVGQLSDPVAWIFVVTLNTARDAARRLQRRGPGVRLSEVDQVKLAANQAEPADALVRTEAFMAARRAIVALAEAEKEVFLLRVSGGRSFEGIADVLGIPVGTAKTRMRTALRHLRRELAPHAPHYMAGQGREDAR